MNSNDASSGGGATPPKPKTISVTLEEAMEHAIRAFSNGDLRKAEDIWRAVLKAKPDHLAALTLLGMATGQSGRLEESASLLTRALALDPRDAAVHNDLGNVLTDLGRLDEAIRAYEQAIALDSRAAEPHNNRGLALQRARRLEEALASFEAAIARSSEYAEAFNNRGTVLRDLDRLEEALESYDRAITLNPRYAEPHYNKGNALERLDRMKAAQASYDHALAINPAYVDAYVNRGHVRRALRMYAAAIVSCDRALELAPDRAEAWNNRGAALADLQRYDEAVVSYENAIALRPDYADAHHNLAAALTDMKRFEPAIAAYEKVRVLDPARDYLPGAVQHLRMHVCDWSNYDARVAAIESDLRAGSSAILPFPSLALWDDPELHHIAARRFASSVARPSAPRAEAAPAPAGERLRIGYFSADFHEHPTAYLMAELFEQHDRSRVETFAFSFGPQMEDPMRRRLQAAFSRFVDVRERSDADVAELARKLGVDVAVDLKGFTFNSRPGIFAARCAPVQVSYLGYPGTLGADYVDYFIADRTVVWPGNRAYFDERIVYLPQCYQVNDSKRPIADRAFTREELGLPEGAFVFCCFNNNYKIVPAVFDVWMRLLRAVPGSVLWLLQDNPVAGRNLRREAEARGVDAARIVFAPRASLADHLARHRMANLFLDTTPCGAHTTASDALWAGLPVLTCAGRSFASRVAASLLTSLDLPELITGTLGEYESQALVLARDAARLQAIREKLAANRQSSSLFDAQRFARAIEAAFGAMVARHRSGTAPEDIVLPEMAG